MVCPYLKCIQIYYIFRNCGSDIKMQEIPRVFMQSGSASFSEKVELITRDGESSYAEFCPRRNFLTGMRDFLRRYAVDENDVIVFQYVKASTFAVSLFKFSGMEFKYNCESTIQSTTVNNVPQPDIILISDSSVDSEYKF